MKASPCFPCQPRPSLGACAPHPEGERLRGDRQRHIIVVGVEMRALPAQNRGGVATFSAHALKVATPPLLSGIPEEGVSWRFAPI